jgi:hypothetical protein
MDRLREFLEAVRRQGLAHGHFRGLLNVLIGRRISLTDGQLVSAGMTWRQAAAALKRVRWDREAVRDLGLDPASLPPRDRQRYWYAAIVQGQIDSAAANVEGDRVAELLRAAGYIVGTAPNPSAG